MIKNCHDGQITQSEKKSSRRNRLHGAQIGGDRSLYMAESGSRWLNSRNRGAKRMHKVPASCAAANVISHYGPGSSQAALNQGSIDVATIHTCALWSNWRSRP